MTQRTRKNPARLMTAGPHRHPLAGDCPLACLAGLLSSHAMGAIRHAMMSTWPERDPERHVIADLAAILRDGRLAAERNVGPAKITELGKVLCAAGFIDESECSGMAASPVRAGSAANWLPADGVLIRELRKLRGWSQAALAQNAGLVTSTITRIETDPNPYCQARTLRNIAAVLEYLPESLTRQAAAQKGQPG
jgi:DNA-binding XRE family transcriptional regulator